MPRLGPKAFEQAAGFLRIMNGKNPLDASAVHPEAYPVVEKIAEATGRPLKTMIGDRAFLKVLKPATFADDKFGIPTITDIIAELEKPGRDPRPEFKTATFKDGVEKITDLKPGMELEGVVTNVAAFGAFVDIGVHQDGLVHISELADRFVKDPHEVVKAGDVVKVRVKEVDVQRKRIGLTMRSGAIDRTASAGQGRPAGQSLRRAHQRPAAETVCADGERLRRSDAAGAGAAVAHTPQRNLTTIASCSMQNTKTTTPFSIADLEATAALVRTVVPETPQYAWPLLASRSGAEVWVKHENHTPIGAFKLRGGLVYMDWLARSGLKPSGVITATRGNHGQSIALAGRRVRLPVTIVVPEGNSAEKNAAMAGFGAVLIVHGRDFDEAKAQAMRLAAERNLHYLPSFHPLLVQGVATYALELFRAVADLDTVYAPIGMGSGICGLIAVRDLLGLDTEIVGVVAAAAPAVALSVEAGRPVPTESARTFADGMACREPDAEALAAIAKGAARIVRVSEAEIAEAIRLLWAATHNVAEGAGAAALAALMQERDRIRGTARRRDLQRRQYRYRRAVNGAGGEDAGGLRHAAQTPSLHRGSGCPASQR